MSRGKRTVQKSFIVFFVALLFCLTFALTGCNGNTETGGGSETDNHTYYTVTFDSMGGSAVESRRVMDGNTVPRPETPTKDGFTLGGWYKDGAAANEWHFDTDRVTGDTTLYAGWIANESAEPTASLTFAQNADGYTVTGVGEEIAVRIPATYNGRPVTAIGDESGTLPPFARKAIVSVVIPDSVTYIGTNAFYNCAQLTTVTLGENSALSAIGNNAFSGTAITSIALPASLATVGSNAFNNCGALNEITVAAGNTHYHAMGNNLIETSTGALLRGSNNSVIPEGVRTIADAAFRRSSIASVNIPASVREIGSYVFDDCAALKEITVNESNANFSAQDGILYNKAATEMLVVPEGIAGAIALPDTLTEIPSFAFDSRTALTSVEIPQGELASIRNFAFRGVTATIHFDGTEDEWAQNAKSFLWGGAALTVLFG